MNIYLKNYLDGLTPKKRDLACEAIAQYIESEKKNSEYLTTASLIYEYCRDMSLLDVEHFDIILLNNSFRVLKRVNICKGGITETLADVRVIFRECLLNNATVLVCVHNHPSGSVTPSKCDDDLTLSIQKAAKVMRVHFTDHVIIGNGCYYSYREQGRI